MEGSRLLSKMRTGQEVTFDTWASGSDSIRFVSISGTVKCNIKIILNVMITSSHSKIIMDSEAERVHSEVCEAPPALQFSAPLVKLGVSWQPDNSINQHFESRLFMYLRDMCKSGS